MTKPLRLTSCIASAALLGGTAYADAYTIDARHTFPSFEVSHLGFSIQRGRFNKTTGHIDLDPQAKKGRIDITIDANSIDTGLEELEARLKKDDFFHTDKYPSIRFESARINFQGDQPVSADGELTLLGVARPVHLTIDHFRCGIHPLTLRYLCGANASATIERSQFGLTAFAPAVGDEVQIRIQVEAFKD